MPSSKKPGISFDLTDEQVSALKVIGGNRKVRLAGTVLDGHLHIDFVACNSPFAACNSAFAACNSSFSENAKAPKTPKASKADK